MRPSGSVPERILSFFAPFVIPKIFQDTYRLREYIRSEEFSAHRNLHGDLYAVDLVFLAALDFTWWNYYEALLISTFAVMDHRNFGIDLPLAGALFWVPLTSEFPDEFDHRLSALPGRLYPDSPDTDRGDRDKLQHFFGSAFLQFVTESGESAVRIGDMVEYGEASFIVGGRADDRDQRANQQGRSFGLALLSGSEVLPSDFLVLVTALGPGAGQGALHYGIRCGSGFTERIAEER